MNNQLIKSKKDAYILGLLFSDGNVCQTKDGRFLISFTNYDIELVKLVKSFIKSKNIYSRINKISHKNVFSVQKHNKQLFMDLCEIGCVPRKSLILNKPLINDNLIFPFLLGVFDGDGSISKNRSINSWKCSIGTGSIEFFNWICGILEKNYIFFSKEIVKKKNNFYNISLCGIMARTFLEKLYGSLDDTSYVMKTKLQKFNILNKEKLKQPFYQNWELEILKNDNLSTKQCMGLINNDPKNFGWIRTSEAIQKTRRKIKKNYQFNSRISSQNSQSSTCGKPK